MGVISSAPSYCHPHPNLPPLAGEGAYDNESVPELPNTYPCQPPPPPGGRLSAAEKRWRPGMMRASILHHSPFLLLAAALVTLAVLFAPGAQPAQAQTTTVWSATLTAADLGSGAVGCGGNVAETVCNISRVTRHDPQGSLSIMQFEHNVHGSHNRRRAAERAGPGDQRAPPRELGPDRAGPPRLRRLQAVRNGREARWTYDGLPWGPPNQNSRASTTLTLGMERPRAGLNSILVHYDGITTEHSSGVDNSATSPSPTAPNTATR